MFVRLTESELDKVVEQLVNDHNERAAKRARHAQIQRQNRKAAMFGMHNTNTITAGTTERS